MSDELDSIFEMHDNLRNRHRIMSLAEYAGWCRAGDDISSCTAANAFPGGLTIEFSRPSIIGRFEG